MAKKALQAMGRRTGLKPSTCEDLLKKGWMFVEQIGEPSRWEGPMVSLPAPPTFPTTKVFGSNHTTQLAIRTDQEK